jgi:hypothetical protein
VSKQEFVFGQYVWDVDAAGRLVAAGAGETTKVPVKALAGLLNLARVDAEYARSHPAPDAPIILASLPTTEGWFHMPIDGWHRIAYWKERGAENVATVALGPQESYETLLSGREAYRKLAKKIDPALKLKSRR